MAHKIVKNAENDQVAKPPLDGWRFWVVFGAATLTFSNWLATFKTFTLLPGVLTAFPLLLATLILVLSLGLLVYDGYVKELRAGTLRHHVKWFDWLYERTTERANQQ